MRQARVIDSHTGGEPTRMVVEGGPALGEGSMSQRLAAFREEHDRFRSAVVNEPRGSDVWVGGLLVPPRLPDSAAAVIFFNNVGYLGMCGHGAIGLAATLAHLDRLSVGRHWIETPVGRVRIEWHGEGEASVANVPSFRWRQGVPVDVPGFGRARGDVAWGGNWFFLTNDSPFDLELSNAGRLSAYAWRLRQALKASGIVGAEGAEIDHIELCGRPVSEGADARNFVLCPGGAYDRSPCGTGTSAKLACLAADGELAPGEEWVQESITGSRFTAVYSTDADGVLPVIRGAAYITADASLYFDERDPLCWGFRGGVGSEGPS